MSNKNIVIGKEVWGFSVFFLLNSKYYAPKNTLKEYPPLFGIILLLEAVLVSEK